MHLEPPHAELTSFKDFAKHYLMIVLSILTALGLEAWIEHTHRTHAAATASAQIEAELQTNLADIERMRGADAQRLAMLTQLDDYLVQAVKDHTDAATIKQHIDAQTSGDFSLGLQLPKLRHEAWDVAVANQSAGWIDAGQLRHYATIYAYQSDFERRVSFNTSVNLQDSKMNDIDADLKAGTLQPIEVMHTVNSMASSIGDTVIALDSMERAFKHELPDLVATAPAAPSH
ncbi:hypothetical protein [Rhodanobacter sp. DHG33]|uniref:hypothetical protein n=1 Tax=Rhodanobacter sp. DHG33 TaxID=2775921 RepID=UPI00177C6DA7|nr:hypothetical protein [Rhodanobacter sp. DHG33]MBD8900498.1 hypothetical protein [Rhodanobacter sp. DHG33]